jgi:tRNA-splicing ligase RtcB (3'-phosphate/5'-hydroxy nucleic acid ligase)
MKEKIKKVAENIYELPKEGKMLVPGRIFASDKIFENVEETCIQQLSNVAQLPGIVGYSFAMSDVHSGYGFPVGGVAAFDLEKGIISPGGIGYDINCGVRLLATNLDKKEFMKKRKEVTHQIKRDVPSGVGRKGEFSLSEKEIKEVMERGVAWAVEKGYGRKEDIENCEDSGCIRGADSSKVSNKAVGRGRNQLGTLGAGNHFLEVQEVEKIYNEKAAKVFGLNKVGQVCVLIHSGSRGLGHQTASDYIRMMEKEYGISHLPDRELACAPIKSKLAEDYLAAMGGAANFAFTNRHLIMCKVRESFKRYFPKSRLDLVYDVAHNIAKFEEFNVGEKKKTLCVHRKGATRSFGKERKELPKKYQPVGQPIFIPGSMGTYSYVLVGTNESAEVSFSSTAHGAGRVWSRTYAKKHLSVEKVKKSLDEYGVYIEADSTKGIVEEAPEAYKNVNEVVRVSDELEIGKLVARLKPLSVVKG